MKPLVLVEGHGDAYDCFCDQCKKEIIKNLDRICEIIKVRAGLHNLGME
jgi:hypothetical protein